MVLSVLRVRKVQSTAPFKSKREFFLKHFQLFFILHSVILIKIMFVKKLVEKASIKKVTPYPFSLLFLSFHILLFLFHHCLLPIIIIIIIEILQILLQTQTPFISFCQYKLCVLHSKFWTITHHHQFSFQSRFPFLSFCFLT